MVINHIIFALYFPFIFFFFPFVWSCTFVLSFMHRFRTWWSESCTLRRSGQVRSGQVCLLHPLELKEATKCLHWCLFIARVSVANQVWSSCFISHQLSTMPSSICYFFFACTRSATFLMVLLFVLKRRPINLIPSWWSESPCCPYNPDDAGLVGDFLWPNEWPSFA